MKVRQSVFDTYWYFAAERQNIFFNRLNGREPLTQDPIFQMYKFCNSYRASDRVSQFLIREVIYNKQYSEEDTLFRIFLFRLLNKSETWGLLEKELGEISLRTFSPDRYARAIESIYARGEIVYGNAFILCATKAFGFDKKHENHMALMKYVFRDTDFSQKLLHATSLQHLFETLRSLPLIGDFMAYQIAIDLNYSDVFNFDENDFTIAGPGAKRGIAKCFEDTNGKDSAYVIQWMVENQDKEFARLGINFQSLWGRKLHAIDCQGLFCETDKYSRVKFPELKSNRVRMKTTFSRHSSQISYFYPPKWGINEKIG